MNFIKDKIRYFNMPIHDIYKNFKAKNGEIKAFYENIQNNDWSWSLQNTSGLCLSNKTQEILSEFGSKLGKTNHEDQIQICDYYINIINEEVNNKSDIFPKKSKLCISLAIYAGLLLIIILW